MDCVTCGASLAGYEGRAAHDQWHRELIAMLAELRFHLLQILPEAIEFAERRLVIVGGLGEQRSHLVTVVAAEGGR